MIRCLLTVYVAFIACVALVLVYCVAADIAEAFVRRWSPFQSLAECRLFVRLFVRGDRHGA